MLSISHPIVLILIPVLIFIWYYFFREKYWFIHPNHIVANYLNNKKKIIYLWLIRFLTVVVLVLTIADIVYTYTKTTNKAVSNTIMIIFDISLSMLAEDMSPNRIETAKSVITDFISKRTNDKIGLIIFAGQPFVSIPFSSDISGIKNIVKNISPYLIRQDLPWLSGTNIGDAILLANLSFSWISRWEKSIILITDGRANLGIDPFKAAIDSKNSNIKIYPIGIGSKNQTELSYTNTYWEKIYFKDEKGNRIISDLDEQGLKKLSQETWGEYFHADNKLSLNDVFSQIEERISQERETITMAKSISLDIFLLLLFITLLAIERHMTTSIIKKHIPAYQ